MADERQIAKPIRVYADTSVFGGVLDDEFARASQIFFQEVRAGKFQLVTSRIIEAEIDFAPQNVQILFEEFLTLADIADVSQVVIDLQQAYLNANILTQRSQLDALHVALATVSDCRLIVSWNFKHIVHYKKIPLYQAVNTIQGFSAIEIYSPLEVISYDIDEP